MIYKFQASNYGEEQAVAYLFKVQQQQIFSTKIFK